MLIDADVHVSPSREGGRGIGIDQPRRRMDRAGVARAITWRQPPSVRGRIEAGNANVVVEEAATAGTILALHVGADADEAAPVLGLPGAGVCGGRDTGARVPPAIDRRALLRRAAGLTLLGVVRGRGGTAGAAPADAATPEPVAVRTLLVATYRASPPAPVTISMVRVKLPPGSALDGDDRGGPRLAIAEAGEVAVVVGAEGVLRTAGGGSAGPMPVAAAATVVLRKGDALVDIAPPRGTVSNGGARAATLLDIRIRPDDPALMRPSTSPTGVLLQPLAIGRAGVLPDPPIELVLAEVTIPRGQSVPLGPDLGPQVLYVESGTLGVEAATGVMEYGAAASNNPSSVAGRVKEVRPGTRALLTAGSFVFRQTGSDGTAENLGRNTLLLMTLTIRPAWTGVIG